jgi:hypothetical protein
MNARAKKAPAGALSAVARATVSAKPPIAGFRPESLHCSELIGGGGTLALVDFQEEFLRALPERSFLAHALDQIVLARRRGWGIVLIETKPWRLGESIPEIQEALAGAWYKRVSKQVTSGSDKVLDACFEMGFNNKLIRVCGVYTDACIKGTAVGLVDETDDSLVRVMKEACATDLNEGEAWADFPHHERLVVSSVAIDRH